MDISISDVFAIQQWWDYVVYGIIFLQLILLVLLFSGSLRDVLLMAVTLMAAFADKGYLFGYVEGGKETLSEVIRYHTTESFMTYAARVAMFALPMIIITQTKIKRARPMAVLVTIVCMVYAFGRWYDQQYEAGQGDLKRRGEIYEHGLYLAQASSVFVIAGEFALRKRWKKLHKTQRTPSDDPFTS